MRRTFVLWLSLCVLIDGGCLLVRPILVEHQDTPGPSGPTGSTDDTPAPGEPPLADTACAGAVTVPTAPVLLFSDLQSGPTTGGDGDLGVFISLYGLRFGATQGDARVYIGGIEVARYVAWNPLTDVRGLERVVVQPGAGVSSGDIVISAGGRTSNPLPFTVRKGRILFVDPAAAEGGDGSVTLPYAHLHGVGAVLQPGDTVFIKGPLITERDPGDLTVQLTIAGSGGLPNAPVALVGHPLNPPTIGGSNESMVSERAITISASDINEIVIANLGFDNTQQALDVPREGLRLVGNRFLAHNGPFIVGDERVRHSYLGNSFTGEGIYFRGVGPVSDLDIGFNAFNETVNALDVNLLASAAMQRARIHDNLMAGTNADPILFANCTLKDVSVYNNVLDGSSIRPLIFFENASMENVELSNNTLVNASGLRVIGSGAGLSVFNNVFARTDHLVDGNRSEWTRAENNFYDAASADTPPDETGSVTGNPLFVNAAGGDFRPSALSPVVNRGAATTHCADYFGVARPIGAGVDIGAIEVTGD